MTIVARRFVASQSLTVEGKFRTLLANYLCCIFLFKAVTVFVVRPSLTENSPSRCNDYTPPPFAWERRKERGGAKTPA